jgi:hypothetical protein
VRLAERVFAPHYAAPMPRRLAAPAALRVATDKDSEQLASLEPGEIFEVLELAGTHAWGVAPSRRLVGYVPAASLERVAA